MSMGHFTVPENEKDKWGQEKDIGTNSVWLKMAQFEHEE